jgi:hypothetical protein
MPQRPRNFKLTFNLVERLIASLFYATSGLAAQKGMLTSKSSVAQFYFRHAYIEFSDASSVANAMVLNESLFRGRLLQVSPLI